MNGGGGVVVARDGLLPRFLAVLQVYHVLFTLNIAFIIKIFKILHSKSVLVCLVLIKI